ncbi:ankyrin repeat-containing domain protein [Aspergillus leporis]|uniref:Ankyrin repeat-containing domain protein n=1 Tax=Aspergillus leporis TaxID=41062 RepID=A0A5N5WI44_9EURO|nr:ankyrin repeat-containing domain protein [Aspergillus leporis]
MGSSMKQGIVIFIPSAPPNPFTLLQHQADVNAVSGEGTPLIRAAFYGSESIVDLLLKRQDIVLEFQNRQGRCALWYAALRGHTTIVKQLLEHDRIKVDCPDVEHGLTPLAAAVAMGHLDIKTTELLLADEHIDLACEDNHGRTPLIYAASKNLVSLVRILLAQPGVHVNTLEDDDRTVLWHAASHGNEEMVELLLQNGGDITAADIFGKTPLHQAIEKGHASIVKMLLSRYVCQPLLCIAARTGNAEIAKSLLDHGLDVNITDAEGRTPLHLAAAKGHDRVVQLLLNQESINVQARDRYRSTALHEAAMGGHLPVLELLLVEPNVEINATDKDHSTSLHHCVKNGDRSLVRLLLLVKWLDPNISDSLTWTPLCCAAEMGDLAMVRLLLATHDVQVNAMDPNQQPPLWLAVRGGHHRVVQQLLQHRTIDVNQGWGPHPSPLLLSNQNGHEKITMLLLAQGERLDVNVRTYVGNTALSIAAHRGSFRVVDRILPDSRADWAASKGHLFVVERLLADPRILVEIEVYENQGPDKSET